jgi:outer membrane protein OmpA-like peptidoglycan-associated protein
MKLAIALGSVLALLAVEPVAAASSYPGEDVTVNPGALGAGYLLYPGGKYGRHVGHLLQPGERPGQTIHLHMPRKVVRVKPRKVTPPVETPSLSASAPAASTPPAATPPPPKRVASTPPPARTTAPEPDLNSLPENSASRLVGPTPPSAAPAASTPPPPKKTVKPASAPFQPLGSGGGPMAVPGGAAAIASQVASGPAPQQTASASPPPSAPAASDTGGLKRQTMIGFATGSSTPGADDINAIHGLAGRLTAALNGGAAKVQILAYGGPRGDKSSDSRRLSLKRALVIRELLIEDGVPSEKIDVRAMGGVDDSGPADRVDIFLRS